MSDAQQLLNNLNQNIEHNHNVIQSNFPVQQSLHESEQNHHQKKPVQSAIMMYKQSMIMRKQGILNGKQTPLLDMLIKQIDYTVPEAVSDMIEQKVRSKQHGVYISVTRSNVKYFQFLQKEQKKQFDHENLIVISDMLCQRQIRVQKQLIQGHLFIQKDRIISKKNQIEELQRMDIERLISIKQGNIKSKLDIMRNKMQQVEQLEEKTNVMSKYVQNVNKKAEQNIHQQYNLLCEKTKIANQYVKHMQYKKKDQFKRQKQRSKQHKKMQQSRLKQIEQANTMKKMMKKQSIKMKIQETKKKKQQQQKQQSIKEASINKFLQIYHRKKPLYKLKQQEYVHRYIKPQKQLMNQKLKEIKEQKKSISIDDIRAHQDKYMHKLSADGVKREELFQMMIKGRRSLDQSKPYFKGFFNQRVRQQRKQQKQRSYSVQEMPKMKKNRMEQYAKVIKDGFKPVLDLKKRNQLLNQLQEQELKKKKLKKVHKQIYDQQNHEIRTQIKIQAIRPEKNIYEEGNKFLAMNKKRIKKYQIKKKQQQIQQKQQQKQIKNSILKMSQQPQQYKQQQQQINKKNNNTLKQIWSIRIKNLSRISKQKIKSQNKLEQLIKKIQKMDKKASQRQLILNYSQLNINQYIDQKCYLDQYYIQSIRNKIKLLK